MSLECCTFAGGNSLKAPSTITTRIKLGMLLSTRHAPRYGILDEGSTCPMNEWPVGDPAQYNLVPVSERADIPFPKQTRTVKDNGRRAVVQQLLCALILG